MNSNTYANYLLGVLALLQVLNMIVFLLLYRRYGAPSLPISLVLMFIVNSLVLYTMSTIKVYDKNGNPVNSFSDLFGQIIAIVVWTAIVSAVLLIAGWFLAVHVSRKHNLNRVGAAFLPLLAVGTLYGSIALVDRFAKN